MSDTRKDILLRAAYDLIRRSQQGPYVQEAASILTYYDGTNCDGNCLADDIAYELDIELNSEPILLASEFHSDDICDQGLTASELIGGES